MPHRDRDPFLLVAILVLVSLVAMTTSSLKDELRFFSPTGITAADGSAPVLQDSNRSAGVDAAFRGAATALSRSAVCVIDKDAWHEDYFRASYIMMPRQIWPFSDNARKTPLSSANLLVAMRAHHADCLLAGIGTPVPAGLRHLIVTDSYSLYVTTRPGSS
jgi:hypothetical protein